MGAFNTNPHLVLLATKNDNKCTELAYSSITYYPLNSSIPPLAILSYAPSVGGEWVTFELTQPYTPNTYVAVGLSKDDSMVCAVFNNICKKMNF